VPSGIARVNGTSLYYEVAGSGEPVVLVHGFSLDSRMWDDQVDALAEGHRVIRYDLRGFGRSELPDGKPYSRAEDLKALLEHLGIGRANIVGLSMGGSVAVGFALSFPEMTHKLILADSALNGYDWSSEWESSMEAIRSRALSAGEKAANALWLEHPLFAPAREKPAVAAHLAQMVDGYSGWHWMNDDPLRVSDPPNVSRLTEVRSPALIVLGDRDLPDFHRIAAILQERIPDSRTFKLQGMGHMVNMEAPEQFNELVLDFLKIPSAGLA
jgi:pimeloyl-ACP methyl ester carboxylesterase